MSNRAGGVSGLRRLWWSLAGRVWLTNLVLVLLMAALGMLSISRLAVLESAVNRVLSRNYLSIEAAHGMRRAVEGVRTGDLTRDRAEADFRGWLETERRNLTEPGEGRLAAEIGAEGEHFFTSVGTAQNAEHARRLEGDLDQLVALNEHAMFSADRRTAAVARRLRTEELILVVLVVVTLGASSYLFARALMLRPLNELLDTLRRIDDERSLHAMAPPRTAELATLADEFNAMAERVESGYRQRLDELQRERSKSEAIIESVEDGLIVLDEGGAVVHINEVACAILDVEARSVIGSGLEELAAHNPHVARLIAARRAERADGSAPTEFKLFIRGRDHTYVSRELPWSGPGGAALGTIVLLQDVTFIRDQERARSNLIATLSHELKTPLTSLAIGAELLSDTETAHLSDRQREILGTIREDVHRLAAIARDLLDASRTSAARIGVERRPIMLDRTVREVCAPLKLQAEEKHIELVVRTPPQPIPIWGDPIKLPWVVTNLVGNALRYTPAGGRICIDLQCEGNVARVTVSDTGPGIAEDVLPRIFEPYAQFPDDPARAGSAGLGLYIAKEIVEAHNGRIFARSRRGEGSSFIVEIPLREEAIG